MPFKFKWLCELLEELHDNRIKKLATAAKYQLPDNRTIIAWFNRYDRHVVRSGPSAVAFLSCLFPERRTDRVYNIQTTRLSSIFGRALGLGSTRTRELNAWRERDGDDFSICVERIMSQCEFPLPIPDREVTLEQIDAALHQLAANSPHSSPEVRATANDKSADELLTPILRRLQSTEAKWLVRLITKSYSPVQIPEKLAMKHFHFMLWELLLIQNSIEIAATTLGKHTLACLPPRPEKNFEKGLWPLMAREVTPQLDIMIKRQPYHKARSIKHCCNIADQKVMSVERKYDGEYCQVHIDMSRGFDCIKIFAKSGRDSTNDRAALENAIKDSLRLDLDGCKIKSRCVIEGELLVWSTKQKRIMPFHKIRKHVKHGGTYLGTAQDSPLSKDEQLMIVWYDLLILDDKHLLNEPHSTRRQHLKALVKNIEGTSIIGERVLIDFSSGRASQKLREHLAKSITQGWEGLVLKYSDEPFFSFVGTEHGIKLKKDYIAGLGDSADLCLVGGSRDSKVERELGLGKLKWTSFQVGCVTNKEQMQRFGAKPNITIIDELTSHSMPKPDLLDLNRFGKLLEIPFAESCVQFDIEMGYQHLKPPTELFKRPFVVEIMGAGFEKLSNSRLWTLRFPRKIDKKVKLHTDRDLLETTSFQELQEMGERSTIVLAEPDSQEDAAWIERLIQADGKKRNTQERSQNTTPGKSPRSAASISIPTVQRIRTSTMPVFVREDTEDLSQRRTPRRSTQGTASTPGTGLRSEDRLAFFRHSAPSESPTLAARGHASRFSSKRLHDCLASTISPVAFKRARLAPTSAPSSDCGRDVSQQELIHSQDNSHVYSPSIERTTMLSNAALSSSFSPDIRTSPHLKRSTFRNGNGKVILCSLQARESQPVDLRADRRPLRAISNPSPGPREVAFVMENDKPPTAVKAVLDKITPNDVLLPTPPCSSPSGAVKTSVKRKSDVIDTEQAKKKSKKSERRTDANVQDPLVPITKVRFSKRIYFGNSVPNKAIPDYMMYDFKSNSSTCTTHDIETFVSDIASDVQFTPPDTKLLHIMLLDFKNTEAAVKDIRNFSDHAAFQSGIPTHPPNALPIPPTDLQKKRLYVFSQCVLAIDYRLLLFCHGQDILSIPSLRKLKVDEETNVAYNCFGGVLKVNKKKFEQGMGTDIILQTDWSWLRNTD